MNALLKAVLYAKRGVYHSVKRIENKLLLRRLTYGKSSVASPSLPVAPTEWIVFDKVEKFRIESTTDYKYCGAVLFENDIYCIPNGETRVLKLSVHEGEFQQEYFGTLSEGAYKWTLGCVYRGKIYGYPRKANTLLEIDPVMRRVRELDLGLQYKTEHHYGGCVTAEGIIYQPPRNGNDILQINLNTFTTQMIPISPNENAKLRYSATVLHSGGSIFFIPEEDGIALRFDPATGSLTKLRGAVHALCFGCVEANDGNLYGFCGLGTSGILKFDVAAQSVAWLAKRIRFSCIGSVIGPDRNIYGVMAGDAPLYRYTCGEAEPRLVAGRFGETPGNSRYAYGVCLNSGEIVCIPAYGDAVYVLRFRKKS